MSIMGARQSWRRKYPRPEADAREQHETKKWRTVVRHSFDDQWAKLTTVPACTSRAAVSSLVASFIGLAIDAIPFASAEVHRLIAVAIVDTVVVTRLISALLIAVVVLSVGIRALISITVSVAVAVSVSIMAPAIAVVTVAVISAIAVVSVTVVS